MKRVLATPATTQPGTRRDGQPKSLALWRLTLVLVCCMQCHAGSVPAADLPDPTRPPGVGATAMTSSTPPVSTGAALSLQAILYAPDRRSAVLNDRSVGEGSTVSGARVLRILPTEVIVRVNGRMQHLHLEHHQPILVSPPAPMSAGVPDHE